MAPTIGTAAGAGLIASAAMDTAQWVVDAIFERGRARDDLDEETEAIAFVVRRLSDVAPRLAVAEHSATTGRLIHYVFGSAFALAYAQVRRSSPRFATANGLAFGIALWLLSDVVLIPAAHVGRSYFRYSRAERFNALASHVVYAMTLEGLLRRS